MIEIKCPFRGGKPVPYRQVCINHIPQVMLEMLCTSTNPCHYIVWTPVGTKVFFIERDERDDDYLDMLLSYLYQFWTLASDGTEPEWHADVFGLNYKSKEISNKSPCIYMTSTSLTVPQVLSHKDRYLFLNINKTSTTQVKQPRRCKGCKEEEWRCKLNPCEVRQNKVPSSAAYQSYKYS